MSQVSKIGYLNCEARRSHHHLPYQNELTGAHKLNPTTDTRLPITIHILHKLIHALSSTCNSAYYIAVFKAMYLTAFHGFLRIGEITVRSSAEHSVIQFYQVKFYVNYGGSQTAEIKIIDYKHNQKKEPFSNYY